MQHAARGGTKNENDALFVDRKKSWGLFLFPDPSAEIIPH